MYRNVYFSIIYNSQIMETVHVSIRLVNVMDKKDVEYVCVYTDTHTHTHTHTHKRRRKERERKGDREREK